MKKVAFIIVAVFLITGMSMAQKLSISGKITDKENNPLPGASVVIKETFLGTSADAEGNYKLSNLKPGNYTLVVSFIGYKKEQKIINLTKDLNLDFALETSAIISDEVVVKAYKANNETPVAKTDITRKEIEERNAVADIPYMLEMTPSVVATSENGNGSGYTYMRIRGTDMSRINVTINGVPLNDGESNGVYWVDLPDLASSTNAIQIQRGVGTSSNGAAAFGASINFQTLTVEPKAYARLGFSAGSFNTYKENISAGTGLLNNKFAFDVRYSKINSDGYIDRGTVDNQSFYFSGSYYTEKTLVKAIVMLGEEHTGITWWGVPKEVVDTMPTYNPAGEYFDKNGKKHYYEDQKDNYWQNHYQLLFSRQLNKHLDFNLTLHATTGKGYYEQYKDDDDFSDYGLSNIIIGNDTISKSDIIRRKWMNNVFYGYIATLNYINKRLRASVGFSSNKYDGDHYGNIIWAENNNGIPKDYEWYNNNGLKTQENVFAKAQYNITPLFSLFGDIQYRHINYKMEGPDDDLRATDQEHTWNFVNPKFGINYTPNENGQAYITFGVANKEPNRADLKDAFKLGAKEAPVYETLYDYEAGYLHRKSNYMIGVNFYYMNYKNQLVNTGKLNSVGYPIMTNVDKSYRAGIELIGGVRYKNLEWKGNFTYSQNKIIDYVETSSHYDENWDEHIIDKNLGTTNISYSPEFIGASDLSYKIKEFKINFMSKYVGEQYIDNTQNEERKIDAYFVNNLGFSYSKQIKNFAGLNVSFFINNIFDQKYIANGYGGNWYEIENGKEVEKSWVYYFPQAGINYTLKVALSF